jgi:hypothetical protein
MTTVRPEAPTLSCGVQMNTCQSIEKISGPRPRKIPSSRNDRRRRGRGQGRGRKGQGSSLPLEAARAISRHARETFPAVGVHTGLVRATCLTSVTGT